MKVLVVGGGGREHAICWKLSQSPRVTELLCAPGNGGIAQVARCIPDVKATDLDGVLKLCRDEMCIRDRPNPKSGTVTMDVTRAVNEIKAGKVEYRVDKTSIVHCPLGKTSFTEQQLGENLRALMDAIVKAKPASAKGTYIRSCVVSSTMGPGIKVNSVRFG